MGKEQKLMHTKNIIELIKRLEYFNQWRRQECDDPSERLSMPHPNQVGKDIDSAIMFLRAYAQLSEGL